MHTYVTVIIIAVYLASKDAVLNLHRILKGKIEIQNRIPLDDAVEEEGNGKRDIADDDGTLSLIYTPGVAHVAREITDNKELAYKYTSKWNNVAIVCDGSRVLGLGNTGPEGAIPVMEGKSALFKAFSGINAFPLCIATQDKEEIVKFVKTIQPIFGAINIEDVESPKVLEIVQRLEQELSIPVFHDDQHGTAVVALAALLNALKIVDKKIQEVKIVIAGAGSAGYGISKILEEVNCKDIIVTDKRGALYQERKEGMDNPYKKEIAKRTNREKVTGSLADVIKDRDVFIGVSGKGDILTEQMVKSMNKDPIIFALSNPDPEILPPNAAKAGAKITATGRSDYANQVNNALVFPYVLRALLDIRVGKVSGEMLVVVANAIAGLVETDQLKEDHILPKINDLRLTSRVTRALEMR
jgi:malate dehydrogenase (oxaloacetate-decarboxylating)